jgi:alkanesulfonate monooxygenase SsuD/methylene tetrahydromethanopterin reductase-like flavin-dependent oxidoreductase (luciferase family)/hemerythrin-like domain-containing protein
VVTDYGHDLLFGSLLTPTSKRPQDAVALAQLSERSGLDLASFQDHPYQPGYLDAWSLLSTVLARTDTIAVTANVINLPLRPPAVLARAAASLDLLSGGRFELALGAGVFWDAIDSMGGRRLKPRQAVQALDEAIDIIRGIWHPEDGHPLHVDGEFYQVNGAQRGPTPPHAISIWLGAYKPRMLALTGRKADGWLPSMRYLRAGDIARGNEIIDGSSSSAGRHPADVRRLLNVIGTVSAPDGGMMLRGTPAQWADQLSQLTLEHGISVFILSSDDPVAIQQFGQEVAPAVRELVAQERRRPARQPGDEPIEIIAPAPIREHQRLGLQPTPDTGERRSSIRLWDETDRPLRPASPAQTTYTDRGRAAGQHLIDVHDNLRAELAEIHQLIEQVRDGTLDVGVARSAINEMTMRQNNWTLGAYCESYCRHVTAHHGLEDESIFPYLRSRQGDLAPVIERLEAEHLVIHGVLDRVDRALVESVNHPSDFTALQSAVDLLTDTMLSHLSYEEDQLVEPLARLGFYAGQL